MTFRLLLSTVTTLFLLVLTQSSTSYAQQFAGANYTNAMPSVPGAEITFWNILDTKGANTSLLTYNNLGTNNKRQNTSKVQKAVIFIHGLNEDPQTYMSNMLSGLATATGTKSTVNSDTISIVCPSFSNGDGKNVAYPWTSGLAAGAGSTSQALVWQGSQWASGAVNQYPYKQTTVSSYAVLDQMLQYYDNAALFPNLKSIVVAGHSLGGQAVSRYAAIGKNLGLRTPVRYWMGNPNSVLWFDATRPVYRTPASVCSTFDAWRDGLGSSLPTYNSALTGAGRAAVLANWQSKSKIYAKGTQDQGDDSSTCNPSTVGQNRDERFYAAIATYPPNSGDNVDYSVCGHDASCMMQSAGGQARLFFDNFSGDGTQALDIGDRRQAGDSPNPSSSNAAVPAIVGTGANGMTYQGCYVDASTSASHSLSNVVSVSGSLSVETCTAACSSAGYTIAGMLGASQCLCGNSLAYDALKVVDQACSTACPGNSAEFCGTGSRLAVWSGGTPSQAGAYSNVNTLTGYSYASCYVDNANNTRALSAKSTSSSSMTVETCAAYCSGYQYFGLEYASECYCGQTLTASTGTGCTMLCAGNNTELCGGSNALSVYNSTTLISSSTTKTSSTMTSTSTTTSSTVSSSTATTSSAATSSAATSSTSTSSTSTSSTSSSAAASSSSNAAYKGCWTDSSSRTLTTQAYSNSQNTVAKCRAACTSLGYAIAGVEYGSECWCGSQMAAASTLVADSDCNMACSGDSTSTCGAGNRLSVYSDLATLPVASTPKVVQSTGSYTFVGCWSDSVSARTLSQSASGGSVETCATSCAGSQYFGVEYGGECYCGSTLASGSSIQATADCNMVCSGAAGELCGGPNRLSLYQLTAGASSSTSTTTSSTATSSTASTTTTSTTTSSTPSSTSTATSTTTSSDTSSSTSSTTTSATSSTPTSTTTSSTTTSSTPTSTTTSSTTTSSTTTSSTTTSSTTTSSTTTSSSTSTSSSSAAASATLSSNYQALGCYADGGARTLNAISTTSKSNTPATCAAYCSNKGYRYSGTEYSNECYCSNYILNSGASSGSGQSGCTMACTGDSSQSCGGPNRLNIVQDSNWQQSFFTVQSKGKWRYQDCVTDTVSPRTLNVTLSGGSSNTVSSCLANCEAKNLNYCGMEYSGECYGAFVLPSTLTSATSAGSSDPIARGCNMACSGNSTQACGGSALITLYSFDSSRDSTATILQNS